MYKYGLKCYPINFASFSLFCNAIAFCLLQKHFVS
nr:MAG TPA: hypothetical protein [Caudoviricetes sp.]